MQPHLIGTEQSSTPSSLSNTLLPEPSFLELQQSQIEKNRLAGLRYVPAKILAPPENISAELTEAILAPYNSPRWYANHANSPEEWKEMIDRSTQVSLAHIAIAQADLAVDVEVLKIANVDVYAVSSKQQQNIKQGKIIIYIHGGGLVYNPGITGTQQAMQLAVEGYRVLSIDYRMLPDHPYPAALDDIYAVYNALLMEYEAQNICIYGSITRFMIVPYSISTIRFSAAKSSCLITWRYPRIGASCMLFPCQKPKVESRSEDLLGANWPSVTIGVNVLRRYNRAARVPIAVITSTLQPFSLTKLRISSCTSTSLTA